MKDKAEDTPPPSPGVGSGSGDDDEMFADEIEEEVDVLDGEAEGDIDDVDEDEMVELPGGIDQLETLMEEYENSKEVVDNSKLVFSKHSGSVFCCSLNSSEGLVATGGEDDKGYVWRLEDGEVMFTMEEWGDSVTEVAWNKDGSMLAAADMAGNIKVWKYPGYKQVWSFELGQDVLWLQWHAQAAVLLAGTAEGQVWVWRVGGAGDSKVLGGSGERVECGKVLGDGRRVVAGYSDGSAKVWDMKTGDQLHSLVGVHKDSIVNVNINNTNLILTGSSDGTVGLWNSNSGKNVGILVCGAQEDEGVEAVHVEDGAVYTGSLGGLVQMWDVSTQVSRWSTQVLGAVTQLQVSGQVLYTGTEEGVVRAVDTRTGEAVMELTGHRGAVLDMVMRGDTGVTVSDDGTARVWDLRVNR